MSINRTLSLAALALGLAACDSNDRPNIVPPDPAPTFNLQLLHASPDAPTVDVFVNGSETLTGVDYKVGTGQTEQIAGTLTIRVEANTPTGNAVVIPDTDIAFAADNIYSVIAVGNAAAGAANPLEAVVLEQPRSPVSAGSARLFVLHGAPAVGEVDVYVTAPGADLAATMPTGTFEFKGTLGPVEVAAGDYQVRVTAPGGTQPVYDSGTITLNDQDDLLLSAVESFGPQSSPVSLLALTGSGTAEFRDIDTPAAVRVTHASPDAPPVEVVANDTVVLVPNLAFPDFTDFLSVAPGTYNIKVRVVGNSSVVPIEADLTFDANVVYDVLAVDTLAGDLITALVLTDDYRPLATSAKVRVIHASPAAQNVDVYVTAPMADLSMEMPLLADWAFKSNTGFVELAPGTYEVNVTPAGNTMPAIGPVALPVDAGDVITVIARDAQGGGAPLDIIVQGEFDQQ